MSKRQKPSAESRVAQGMHFVDPITGAVIPPIQPSTTFARDESYNLVNDAHSYGRDDNPGYLVAERMLAGMEGAVDAMLFSSGMAAAASVVQALKPGDHIVAPTVMYWGLRNWLVHYCRQWGLDLDLFDVSDPQDLERKVRANKTTLVWLETPCNPTWDVIDIEAAAAIAKNAGARLAVDSTVATPVLTQPIGLGADIVMHSATKYLNGHGDIIAGALLTAQDDDFWQQLRNVRAEGGAILGSFESWLLQRGMRTLYLRVRHASAAALQIAQHFSNHGKLRAVLYPGLESHPGHAVAARQMHGGYGGMLSIRVKGGAEEALAVAGKLKVFIRATSLGGVESLAEHRYSIEGPDSPVPADLIRLSIGIEKVTDLIDDLEQALA